MMNISCLQENLAKALATVGRAIPTRTTLPITECVMLYTENGALRMRATNLECEVATMIGAQVEEPGAVAIPYRRFADLVSSLPPTRVDIEIQTVEENDDGTPGRSQASAIAKVTADRSVTHLNTMPADSFPPARSMEGGTVIKVDAAALRNAVSMTQFSTGGKQDNRPALQGILMRTRQSDVTLVSADGFRLSINTIPSTKECEDMDLIIPVRTMVDVHRLSGGQSGAVEITVAADQAAVQFQMDEAVLNSQLIKAEFPAFERLVPDSYTTSVTMDLEDFRSAVQTANVFAKDGSGIIRMEIDQKENQGAARMRLSARAEQAGDNTREIDIDQLEGDPARIAFNCRYLQEICSAMGKGKITFEMNESETPGAMRFADDTRYLHIMMPMKVDW